MSKAMVRIFPQNFRFNENGRIYLKCDIVYVYMYKSYGSKVGYFIL